MDRIRNTDYRSVYLDQYIGEIISEPLVDFFRTRDEETRRRMLESDEVFVRSLDKVGGKVKKEHLDFLRFLSFWTNANLVRCDLTFLI